MDSLKNLSCRINSARSDSCNTYKNIEIVIVNDGSSDNSHRRILAYIDARHLPYLTAPTRAAIDAWLQECAEWALLSGSEHSVCA